MLSGGGVKYHFLSLWYDSTWDWTPVSCAISEHLISVSLCYQVEIKLAGFRSQLEASRVFSHVMQQNSLSLDDNKYIYQGKQ